MLLRVKKVFPFFGLLNRVFFSRISIKKALLEIRKRLVIMT